jgi:hypothetical protein
MAESDDYGIGELPFYGCGRNDYGDPLGDGWGAGYSTSLEAEAELEDWDEETYSSKIAAYAHPWDDATDHYEEYPSGNGAGDGTRLPLDNVPLTGDLNGW